MHHQTDPIPARRAAAPSIGRRHEQPELASAPALLPHQPVGNGAQLNREPRFRQKAFHPHFFTFFLAINSEIASERARAPRLAPLLGMARCQRRWYMYISKLVCDGDSEKNMVQTWRGRRPSLPAATVVAGAHVRAHGRVKHIYSGGGPKFFCVPHVCFELVLS